MKNIKRTVSTFSLLFCLVLSSHSGCTALNKTQQKRVDISTFGAIPNDDLNDSDAFRKAMTFCRENPGTTLFIPSGTYNFRDEEAAKIEYEAISGQYGENVQGRLFQVDAPYVKGLDLHGSKDITIEADGATLLLEGWYETISIVDAQNISIKGLTIMHKRPPYTIGTIINVTSQYFDMHFDTVRYSFLGDNITGRMHFFDVEKQRVYTGAWHEKKDLIDKATIRVHSGAQPKIGDKCILRHSAHYRAGIFIKESSDILIQDVKLHSQCGMGVVGHRSENITMRNLQVIPEAGSVISTNTDATHFTSCKGKIILDACKFGGQGDDCTNIHNYYWSIYKGANNNQVAIAVEGADLHSLSLDFPDVGDTIALVSKENLNPTEHYVVKKVDTNVQDMRPIITLDKDMTHDISQYYMTNLTRRPSVEITNNTVRSHMARAYLIKTHNVRIAGNVIQGSSGSAIQLGAEAGWRESGPVQNILIENNWITGCGYGHGGQKGSVISVEVNGIKGKPDLVNKNITIRSNVIEANGTNAIYLSGTKGINISDNEISGSINAIYIEDSESIITKNNGSLSTIIKNKYNKR